jgi:hypothetical protein
MRPKTYNPCTIQYLHEQGYHPRHIAIVIGCCEDHAALLVKDNNVESTFKFATTEEKKRLYVLDKFLQIRRMAQKWCSDDYYYITILRFLLVPRDTIYSLYRGIPHKYYSNAYKEKSPIFVPFDYTLLNITAEEYKLFVASCYNILGKPEKWR